MLTCLTVRGFFALVFILLIGCNAPVNAYQLDGKLLDYQPLDGGQQSSPARPPQRPNPAFVQIDDRPGLPRVLLLGDSISIGYTLYVRRALEGKANVHRPAANCASTRHGLKGLDEWLGEKPWDVIHFNFGLHDLKHVLPGTEKLVDVATEGASHQVPLDEYRQNLTTIVQRLKTTGATLIWRATTPVPEGAAGRYSPDAELYNAVAREIMEANQIEIDDLYTFALDRLDELQQPKNVHFTEEGSETLAKHVAAAIASRLPDTK